MKGFIKLKELYLDDRMYCRQGKGIKREEVFSFAEHRNCKQKEGRGERTADEKITFKLETFNSLEVW